MANDTYKYRITNSDGCTSAYSDNIIINAQPSAPSLTTGTITPASCSADGSIALNFTNVPDGTYSISYSSGSFDGVSVSDGNAIISVPADTYSNLQVTSANGCISATGVDVNLGLNCANLSIIKTVNNSVASVGSNVIFTIKATNSGPGDATGVIVTDELPTGYKFVSASPSIGTWNSRTWSIGNLANGASETLSITATVNSSGNYINTAKIKGTETDPDPTDNEDDTTVTPGNVADLSILKTVDNPKPNVGTNVVFTIKVTNKGSADATGVNVTDNLPTGYTFVSASPSIGTWFSPVWSIGNIAKGASETLLITATVNSNGNYINTATVTGTQTDPDPTNNKDDVSVTPTPIADLSIIKTVDNANASVGSNVVFSITVNNNGPSDATSVKVTDNLPTGYTFVSASPSFGKWSIPTWTIGNLANGASETIQITAKVNSSGIYTNTANVTGNEADPIPSNNNDNISINQSADLSIVKTVDNPNATVGSNVIFTITVINNGPGNATNVVATDNLPTGYSFVSASASLGTWNSPLWSIGNLANGASETLSITAKVNSSGIYTNTANVTANEPDPNLSNNNDEVSIAQIPITDLAITKTVDVSSANIGSDVVFTLTVTNNGPNDATGVIVTDKIPLGYTFVSDNASGAYNSVTGIWTIGNLVNGANASIEITATLNRSKNYLNIAKVSGNETDTNLENNEASASVNAIEILFIPEGISPNHDGKNDKWEITGLEQFPSNKVTIFNRWGNRVYEASPYLNDWDGTNMFGLTVGGKDLPVGTYFYIIEPGNGDKAIKGYIYLAR